MWARASALAKRNVVPTLDDVHLMVQVVLDHLGDVQGARHAVDQRDGIDAERVLQLGHLEQLVEDDLGDRVALQFDDESGTNR